MMGLIFFLRKESTGSKQIAISKQLYILEPCDLVGSSSSRRRCCMWASMHLLQMQALMSNTDFAWVSADVYMLPNIFFDKEYITDELLQRLGKKRCEILPFTSQQLLIRI